MLVSSLRTRHSLVSSKEECREREKKEYKAGREAGRNRARCVLKRVCGGGNRFLHDDYLRYYR